MAGVEARQAALANRAGADAGTLQDRHIDGTPAQQSEKEGYRLADFVPIWARYGISPLSQACRCDNPQHTTIVTVSRMRQGGWAGEGRFETPRRLTWMR